MEGQIATWELRRAPGACGEAPGGGGIEEESRRSLGRDWKLFRILRGQQAEALKLSKREDYLFASVTHFQATQAS